MKSEEKDGFIWSLAESKWTQGIVPILLPCFAKMVATVADVRQGGYKLTHKHLWWEMKPSASLHVHQRTTKHFIAKLFAQPYMLLNTFSILVALPPPSGCICQALNEQLWSHNLISMHHRRSWIPVISCVEWEMGRGSRWRHFGGKTQFWPRGGVSFSSHPRRWTSFSAPEISHCLLSFQHYFCHCWISSHL